MFVHVTSTDTETQNFGAIIDDALLCSWHWTKWAPPNFRFIFGSLKDVNIPEYSNLHQNPFWRPQFGTKIWKGQMCVKYWDVPSEPWTILAPGPTHGFTSIVTKWLQGAKFYRSYYFQSYCTKFPEFHGTWGCTTSFTTNEHWTSPLPPPTVLR